MRLPSPSRIVPSLVALSLAAASASTLRATVALFRVDPAATSLALQAHTDGEAWQEQAPGSLACSFTGWLAVDFEAGTVQFLVGSSLQAVEASAWQPGPRGTGATVPADFGAKTTVGSGLSTDHELAAIRGLRLAFTSDPLALDQGTFDASALGFSIPAFPKVTLDYRSNGLLITGGQRTLSETSIPNEATGGVLSAVIGEVQTLSVPVGITLKAQTLPGGDVDIRLAGQIVARRGLTLLSPIILMIPSEETPGLCTFVWASPFKLQKATRLDPADWTDVATDAPASVTLGDAAGFFRVTH